jgi:hypothetical protein
MVLFALWLVSPLKPYLFLLRTNRFAGKSSAALQQGEVVLTEYSYVSLPVTMNKEGRELYGKSEAA